MSPENSSLGPDHDPAVLEAEVIRLRDDCVRLVHELEQRYRHAVALPRRLAAQARRVGQGVRSALRGRPVHVAVAAGLLVFTAALAGYELRMRRRRFHFFEERQLRRAHRRIRRALAAISAR